MYKITCIIVEDEPLAARVLADYISQVPFLELRGSFKDAFQATAFLHGETPDLIFLDIHLPKLKGLQFLRTLPNPPSIIFTTAYHQYAVEAFNLNVTDYLLKPIEFERFMTAVNKVQNQLRQGGTPAEKEKDKDYLFLMVQKKKTRIWLADILYVESQREYIRVVTTRGEYLSKMSTHEIEAMLPAARFKRIHRSFIIAADKVESYTADEVELPGARIPVGRAYREVLEGL